VTDVEIFKERGLYLVLILPQVVVAARHHLFTSLGAKLCECAILRGYKLIARLVLLNLE
jgi:hypothetical protein